ncbi:NADH-quinone oxidoreductase subunit NuoF [Candidatus Poribacteria bacterium]|nr:NADH-quinone oxidoreductase subunit NuoF [Candidatus Poribacteria bacterium]
MAEVRYRSYVLCCGGTSCSENGSQNVISAFNEELRVNHLDREVKLVITGCQGLCEVGPIVAVYPHDFLYCNVRPEDVPEIVEETLIKGKPVDRLLYTDPADREGVPQYHDMPLYKNQVRVILQNCGFINPERIEEYIARDGYQALAKALYEMTPEEVIEEVKRSGLRGRGGGGFPTGLKWEFTRRAKGDVKYIVCNADEGDPGAFMDRSLIEGDPHSLLEGMLIAGYAIGAQKGYIYCRAEYPLAIERLRIAIAQAREYGLLGENILGTDFSFDIEIKEGAGAFVCGEETALLASIEERRGEPRPRPPFPATSGLWGKPTNINNVKSYATVPKIILRGADWFASMGTERSKGTAVFALTGRVNNTGLVEVPMGITLGEIIFDIGGGIAKGRKFKAVQTGGPLGGCLPAEFLNTPVDYDSLKAAGATMGSGGMIVVDETTCMVELARFFLQFATAESCGQCPPCRIGGQKLLEILNRITRGEGRLKDLEMIEDIANTMREGSLCALGQLTPSPVLTTLRYFRDEYLAHIIDKRCPAGTCAALVPAPCRNACPAEVNVPVYVSLIAEGKYDEALEVHRQANPFPSICGRVCPAFCESRCRRGELDEPVAIRQLKRFMADRESRPWTPKQIEPDKEEKVAVVGGGPGGLTAALRLAQLGYNVTIYEALPVLGGMMAVGIPEYRLPKDVLRNEIDSILRIGKIDVKTETALGRDVSLKELRERYDAVLLAIGAHSSRKLNIPGEDKEGVIHGVDFLKRINLGEDMSFVRGKRAAVIGGGDVAIDVSRSLLRLGASEVHILYRRRREDMPAVKEEVSAAEEEGVKIHFLVTPIEVLGDGEVTGIRCQLMKLEDERRRPSFDSSARKRPFPIEGAEFVLDVDLLIPTIGQSADTSFLREEDGIELERDGTFKVDRRTFLTTQEGVFAIGDAVTGPASVVSAVGQGNKVAKAIHRYLRGMDLLEPAKPMERPERVGEFEMAPEDAERPRAKASILAPEVRISDFREVELGFPNEIIAQNEARRCLRCDLEPVGE